MSENLKIALNDKEMILIDGKQNKIASFLVQEYKKA